jgi:hypothetical protein
MRLPVDAVDGPVSGVDELVAFLTARWDERERVALAAQAAAPGMWMRNGEGDLRSDGTGGNGYFATGPWDGGIDDAITEHMLLGDPASVLADIASKRAILALHGDSDFPYDPKSAGPGNYSWTAQCQGCYEDAPCRTVRLLAQSYAGQDGWREEWRA